MMMICIGCCPTASVVYDYIFHVLSNFSYVYVASKSECPCKKEEDKLPDHITKRNESTFTIQDV